MSQSRGVTVEQLAELIAIPLDRLKLQLEKAGISVTGLITESQKKKLLDFLKQDHGEPTKEIKKITLNRKSVSEIKVQRSSGKKSTVSVVRKRRQVYVKKEAQDATDLVEEVKSVAPLSNGSVTELEQETFVEEKASNVQKAELAAKSSQAEPLLTETKTAPAEAKTDGKSHAARHKGKQREHLDEEEKGRGKGKLKSSDDKDWKKNTLRAVTLNLDEDEESGQEVLQVTRRRRTRSKGISPGSELSNIAIKSQKKHLFEKPQGPIVREIAIPETITVADLAQKMSIKASEVIKVLMKLGTMATINQTLDQETSVILVESLGHTVKRLKDVTVEDELNIVSQEEALPRGPIVTVMGHVDHGKTSLLDYIRRTKVASQEAGGITQHIGAYHVETPRGNITFLDTPGHAAFTSMRARGVQCTDIVILVVAADDGVMPQTIEAIQHARAANVPIVVAVNKMDKPDADLKRVQNDLAQQGVLSEAWGGDVIFVPVSAREGTGIDALLEAILLQAEMLELKTPVKGLATGVVLEARLDKGRGPVASILVQSGTLHQGDMLVAGREFGRARAMHDELGHSITSAGPSIPVEILGLSGIPLAGDTFVVVQDERKARELSLYRQTKHRDIKMASTQVSSLDGLFDRLQQSGNKILKVVLKADVQGSAEAIAEALNGLSTEEIKVKVISQGVGGINESDITLAMASEALVIGFNVRADALARRIASKEGIDIEYFSIIYDVVDGVKRAINGLLGPEYKEKILGTAEVRDVFRSAKLGAIAGCMVVEGLVKRGCPIRVLRNNVVIYQGELESLRRFKEDATEVRHGMECGIGVKNYNDVKPGDQIEVYEIVQVNRNQA